MFNFQIPAPMADELRTLADRYDKKLSAYIKDLLLAHIAQEQHNDDLYDEITKPKTH